MLILIGGVSFLSNQQGLGNIKSRTVGDGQHGAARFATPKEIRMTYVRVPFRPREWRAGRHLPSSQGVIVGCEGKKDSVTAIVDEGDVHVLVLAASGAGKTAYFLYPNVEYACAAGMSFLCTDTKGDLFRNYAGIAKRRYGYEHVAIFDLRNPTRSDSYNFLYLVNRYMDAWRIDPTNLTARAKAEKYAKIISKTIINTGGDSSNHGQNAFFYDAAEGLMTSIILLMAEFLPPEENKDSPDAEPQLVDKRHIISAYKLIQDLLAPTPLPHGSKEKPKSQYQILMNRLPKNHKARWFAGAALNSSDQAMASVMSTVLSRLNAFIDSEMEQILCFDTAVDAETFCNRKSAVFVILPEEDVTKYFLVSLFIQQFYREILAVADEHGGKLKRRVVFYCDELGTIPPIDSLELIFSASRSRGLLMVPIIQGLGQLRKNYGADGASIIVDNCQDVLAGGFAPTSETADTLSKALGNRTILSGSVSRGRNDPSQTLQMMERPLMTSDELRGMPRGNFILMKTGEHPMRTRLRLFHEWGIRFEEPYEVLERAARTVHYADSKELEESILAAVLNDRSSKDTWAVTRGRESGAITQIEMNET
ncbi:type IV secretory system conjugative DNA transfer family protein, partial [Ruminococcaceae bacterium OttesenSCG-928-I18]|nr:type IV secretory system conjugative DNA transfer family protein [Ruminococcaceae bacterium OttesenSCG-928-I18]